MLLFASLEVTVILYFPGRTEVCQRLHTFIISSDTNDTNRTSLTYMSMHSSEPVVITFEDPLPSPLLCGTNYDRCNAVVTSNTQETIRIVVFPLDTGIGLVSFNYSTRDDTLIYRDHFLLPQNVPDCTFIHFVVLVNVEIIGYCVELHPSKIRAFKIHVELLNLTKSLILRRQDTFEISDLSDITSLSNFVFFFQDRLDSCFNNEGNHVLFLNGGEIYDHSFFDGRISPFMYEGIDATCSSLHRVGSICNVVAHCNSSTLVFDTRGQEHNSIFTEAEYGQTFFCPSEDFISFRNGVLTLHDQSRVQFGNPVSFPLGEIYEGHCLNVDDNFFFVAIIDDGGTILVNFTDASYRGLGDCDFSTAVPPARVKDHFAIVNNGSDTQVYNLGLACMPEPLVLPRNFRLVTSFSTRTMDQCRCLEPSITTTISPSEPSVPEISPTLSSSPVVLVSDSPSTSTTSMLESQSMLVVSTSSTPTPTNEPASNGVDSPNVGGISSGVVAGAILMVAISLSIIITLLLIRKCYM